MDRHFAAMQKPLKADPALNKVRLVTVSFDPATDTPPVLKAHAKKLNADFTRWTFLTGDRDEVDQFAARFGVSVGRALNDARDITHNLRTAIIDADGQAGEGRTPATSGRRSRCSPTSSACVHRRVRESTRCSAIGVRTRMTSATAKTLFTPRERRLIARLRTPLAVQQYLNRLPYNQEPHGRATLRSFRGVVRHGCAHCLEAALFAAVVLEQHGYPPLVLSFESIDELDHVIFVYRRDGRWGSVARSRDPGLHGRKAGVRHAARARAQLLSIRTSISPAASPATRVVDVARDGRLRLAAGGHEHLEGRADAARLPAPPDRLVGSAGRRAARAVPGVPAAATGRKPVYYKRMERWTALPQEIW